MAAQLLSSVLFERSLRQGAGRSGAPVANGALRARRANRGGLSSQGRLILSPLLGRPWRLELNYTARHGILSTDVEGTLLPRL